MEPIKKSSKKNKAFALVLGVLVTLGLIFGIGKYIHGLSHEETEDAQVEADINPIIPKVSGFVDKLNVDDNQLVKAGDTLVTLDDRDLKLRVLQAQAALENAKANLASAEAGYITTRENVLGSQSNLSAYEASIELAEVRKKRAGQDFERYKNLIASNSVTQQQFEQAEADLESATRQLEVSKKQKESVFRETASRKAQSNVSEKNISLARTVVKEREADLEFANLQLSYAYIIAPASGVISRKSVQPGQLVQAGQSLFALVSENQKWVVANFKETQLEKMKPGQSVEITVDAYPDDTFKGKVESISPATGAKFALLPADNASGNFVKVVQRIPVKIVLDNNENAAKLRAGMNVIVDVQVN